MADLKVYLMVALKV
jgi:hypothetical protein